MGDSVNKPRSKPKVRSHSAIDQAYDALIKSKSRNGPVKTRPLDEVELYFIQYTGHPMAPEDREEAERLFADRNRTQYPSGSPPPPHE